MKKICADHEPIVTQFYVCLILNQVENIFLVFQ